jgi:1-acylglycerone phosphate reductase
MPPKTILITGCSAGGIGDGLAQAFHQRGQKVIATARSLSKIRHLKELGITVLALDVTIEASLKEAAENVSAITGGRLDILVNNAGLCNPLRSLRTEIS